MQLAASGGQRPQMTADPMPHGRNGYQATNSQAAKLRRLEVLGTIKLAGEYLELYARHSKNTNSMPACSHLYKAHKAPKPRHSASLCCVLV